VRGLVTYKGVATNYMDSNAALQIIGGDFADDRVMMPFHAPAGTETRILPTGALSLHKGTPLIQNPEFGGEDTREYILNPNVACNPLAHAEASYNQCDGKPRLQLMIDQLPEEFSL